MWTRPPAAPAATAPAPHRCVGPCPVHEHMCVDESKLAFRKGATIFIVTGLCTLVGFYVQERMPEKYGSFLLVRSCQAREPWRLL